MQSWQSAPVIGQQPAAQPTAQPVEQQQPRRIFGAPEAPKQPTPPAPKDIFRDLTPAEVKQRGLAEGGVYQVNALGEIKIVQPPPKGGGPASPAVARERLARIRTSLDNLRNLQGLVSGSDMGTGSIVGQESFRAGEDYAGLSSFFNQRANDVAGSIEMVQGDLINQVRQEMEQSGTPIGVKGADTEKEASRLAASIANLAQTQDEGEFLTGVGRAREYYIRRLVSTVQAMQEAGEDITPQQVLSDFLQQGATKAELKEIGSAFGLNLNEEQLDANLRSRDQGGPVSTFTPPEGPGGGPSGGGDPLESSFLGELGRASNAFNQAVGDAVLLGFGDEISNLGGRIGAALRGEDIEQGGARAEARDAARTEAAREYLGPTAYTTIGVLSGGAGGRAVSGVQAGLSSARGIAAAGAPVTRQAIQRDLTRRAAASGAALGGVAGAGQGETLQERGVNALSGAALGGALGGGGQAIGNRFANRATAPVVQSADRLGIDVTPAVAGGTVTQRLTSGAQQGFISQQPINRAVTRMEGQALAARERIASEVGEVVDDETAGNIIRQAGNVFSERTSRIGGKLYDRVETLGSGQKFPLTGGVAKADEWLADVGRSVQGKEGAIYKEIAKLRDSMASGEFDVMSIPRTRDEFRTQLQERGLRGSTLDTAIKQILNEAENDILNGLQQSGNARAVGAFKTATEFWRKRVETIDQFFDPVLGKNAPKSGEQVITALENMANPRTGNASRLAGIMKAMRPEEASSIRATIINRMGRATAGSANNRDEATFSFNTFATNWNNMSARAKAVMFPKEQREALNDLMRVSTAVKEAGASANRSNTAGAIAVQAAISTPVAWFLHPLATGSLAIGQYATGRLLASPKFARLLANAPRNRTPATEQAFNARLANLAKAEPQLAQEIGIYQRALAANDNTAGALAAEEQQPNERQ